MNWPRALALFAVAFAFAGVLAVAGPWVPPAGLPLVQVLSLAPTDVEPGDRIAIAGEGFPAGKEARVRFQGTLYRPGQEPVRDAEVLVTGTVTGPEQVEVDFREAAQALFCGAGDRAVHTTFEGDVEVAFASAAPGAAPVAGVLRHAVLDVRPSASAIDRANEADGARALEYMGLRVTVLGRKGLGLAVDAVQPGSPADMAGVGVGDVIVSVDGVRSAAVGDLVPAPGDREATLGVRSQGATTDTARRVSVDGLRRAPPAELLDSAIVIAAALGVMLLLGSPAPAVLATALQRAASRLRARAGVAATARRSGWPLPWVGPARAVLGMAAREVLPPASPSALIDAGVAALLAVMPFGQYLVAARMDVELLFFVAATALAVVAVVSAGSASSGLRAAAHVAWQHEPAALAVASVVLTTGSLRLQEIDRAQGGYPWDWLAFRSPAALVSLVLLLRCAQIGLDDGAVPTPAPVETLVDDTTVPALAALAPRGQWLAAARRAHRFIVAGLASALFLGGWSLPGLSPAQHDGRVALELAAAAWFLAKTGTLVLGLSVLREAFPARRLLEGTRVTTRREVPLALAALCVTAAWTRWSPEGASQLLVSGSLVALAALAGVVVVQRLRHGLLSPGGDGHLSPFL